MTEPPLSVQFAYLVNSLQQFILVKVMLLTIQLNNKLFNIYMLKNRTYVYTALIIDFSYIFIYIEPIAANTNEKKNTANL